MQKIRGYLCSGTDIDFRTTSPEAVLTCCVSSDRFTITKFNEGCTLVTIDPAHKARIDTFVEAFGPDFA